MWLSVVNTDAEAWERLGAEVRRRILPPKELWSGRRGILLADGLVGVEVLGATACIGTGATLMCSDNQFNTQQASSAIQHTSAHGRLYLQYSTLQYTAGLICNTAHFSTQQALSAIQHTSVHSRPYLQYSTL